MATDKKITTVRLSDRHRGILDRLVTESGLSISAVIEQLLECTNTHQSDITLNKLPYSSSLSLKIGDSTKSKSDSTLKGAEAQQALFRSQPKYLSTGERVLWFDSWLWQAGKSANGSQDVLSQLMEYPQVLFNALEPTFGRSSKEEVIEALRRWNELRALEHIEKMGDRFFTDGCYFFNSHGFRSLKEDARKAIADYSTSLQEATSALDPVNEEIATEAITEAPIPLENEPVTATESSSDEAQTLPKNEFKVMFGLSDAEYSLVATAGKDLGWLSPSGDRWFISGSRKARLWTKELKVISL